MQSLLHVDPHVVTGKTNRHLFVVHFDRLDFCSSIWRGKSDIHSWPEYSCLDTTNGHNTNAADLEDIMDREAKRFVGWVNGFLDGINGF